jgi:transcriptional regulator with XRE-family HTH domain
MGVDPLGILRDDCIDPTSSPKELMDVASIVKQRLADLGLEQKDLAAAAGVTESYISQLLNRKKLPPAPGRTKVYEKIARFLKLPSGELTKLAANERREEMMRSLGNPQPALLKEVREFILRKALPSKEKRIREVFEKEPFGEVERLVTQKLLEVAKRVATEELNSENWLRLAARLSGRSYREMRLIVSKFMDANVFDISAENFVSFLEPLIESWNIDFDTFGMEIVLSSRLSPGDPKRFEFVESSGQTLEDEPGFKRFLQDSALSSDISKEEIEFLKKLRFRGRRPTPLYYYRELQNLRDPLSFERTKTKGRRK